MMQARVLTIACAALLGGCAAQPRVAAPHLLTFPKLCHGQSAPVTARFGRAGLRAVYHFVTAAPDAAVAEFFRRAHAQGFRIVGPVIELNGIDTKIAFGPAVLHNQEQAEAEFKAACRLGPRPIYLTHVRYNPEDPHAAEVRVR